MCKWNILNFLFVCFCIFFSQIVFSNTYYVSTTGLNSNAGTLIDPWDISHAFSSAQNGDTVWIKAGNYGFQNLNIASSNTTFIGYTVFPGDLSSMSIPDSLATFLASNYDLIYPTIDGIDRANSGTCINFGSNKSNITIKNFQIRNFRMGISLVGRNNLVENIIGNNFGDVSVFYDGFGIIIFGNKNTLKNAFVLNSAAEGIRVSGDSNLVQYCKVYCNDTINAMEQGNPNTKYGDTDYYIYVTANTNTKQGKYNIVENCYLERFPRAKKHVGHGGHGFSFTISYNHKACTSGVGYCYDEIQKDLVVEHNIFRNCTTKNIDECVMLRGDKVKYNLIEDVSSLSYGTLRIQNSASYNTFNRCHIKNTYYWKDPGSSSIYRTPGVDFLASYYGDSTAQNVSSPETNSYPWELEYAGHHNTFTNSIFENVAAAVNFNNYSEFYYPSYHPLSGQAIDRINRKRIVSNSFINCTFLALPSDTITMLPINRPSLFIAMRGNEDNTFTNCIFEGFYNFESRVSALNTTPYVVSIHGIIPTNVVFKNSVFNANNFDDQIISNGILAPVSGAPLTPGSNNQVAGTFIDCIVQDPLFFDRQNGNYHLVQTSPCIDAGLSVFLIDDYDQNIRPSGNGYDIGAYEFQNTISTIHSEELINSIIIYPNPSRDVFNVAFTSEDVQDLEVRVINIVGEVVYTENLQQFVGEYTKSIDLVTYTKGVYFLEITTNNGVVNKKLILQ